MDTQSQLNHLDHYKILKDEIMQYIREIYRTELSGAIAAGAIYTWLLTHKTNITSRAVWFIAPCLIFIGALRSLELTLRITYLGAYLKRIEEVIFGRNAELPGWEHYKLTHHNHRTFDILFNISAGIAWAVVFIGSIILSYVFSR